MKTGEHSRRIGAGLFVVGTIGAIALVYNLQHTSPPSSEGPPTSPAPRQSASLDKCSVQVLSKTEARSGTLKLGKLVVHNGSASQFNVNWDQDGSHKVNPRDTTSSINGVASIGYGPFVSTSTAEHDVVVSVNVNGRVEQCGAPIIFTAQPDGTYALPR